MSQNDLVIANQSFPSFRTDLNSALQAIFTTHSGTSLPSGASAGTIWLDTTSATTPTLKYYDGTDNISLATIDHVGNTVNWLDSTVSITGLSTTATGTVLTLSDSATTSTVNLIIDNDKEIRFREATANGTNYVSLSAPASLSADLTFTLPSADGTSGQVLQTNGSGVLSFATVGGLAWQTIITGATLSAVASRGYWIDTTSNACTVTLPASAVNGDTIILADYARNWGTNAVTINTNSLNFQGNTSPNPVYNTSGQSVTLVYSGATKGWIPTVDDNVTLETPQPYSVDFLVVAGGGGGGEGFYGGGGGAGGFRTSTQSVSIGTVITVTVGDGGAGSTSQTTTGSSGSNSSISGSGLTTITSAGGGGGGSRNNGSTGVGANGVSGGSGGGASYQNSSGGSGNTPSTSPSQGNNGGTNGASEFGGSGGGAGAAGTFGGVAQNSPWGAVGGIGSTSSITGTSTYYAGGGGGGGSDTVRAGGSGGGGAGGTNSPTVAAVAGTANTGGGGGGGGADGADGGAGGKGVVILSIPTASYSSTSTGSPTVTTSGSNTILSFTGSGTYTG
jgi:hypothetical protein